MLTRTKLSRFLFTNNSDDLPALIAKHWNIPIASKKWILREVGEALKDFHAKEWIDIGTWKRAEASLPLRSFTDGLTF